MFMGFSNSILYVKTFVFLLISPFPPDGSFFCSISAFCSHVVRCSYLAIDVVILHNVAINQGFCRGTISETGINGLGGRNHARCHREQERNLISTGEREGGDN